MLYYHAVCVELASSGKGGKVLEASDELFGEGFHLIKDGPAIEDKNRETANGFWKVKKGKES
jgi:allantoicase